MLQSRSQMIPTCDAFRNGNSSESERLPSRNLTILFGAAIDSAIGSLGTRRSPSLNVLLPGIPPERLREGVLGGPALTDSRRSVKSHTF
jgi:hypothetical protein